MVRALVESINQWHPESGIIALSDGPVDEVVIDCLKEVGVSVALSPERLKVPGRCEEYLSNGFTNILSLSNADRFIQVDPDSVVRRRAKIPAADWAGQVFWAGGAFQVLYTVGAGASFSRRLIEQLVSYLEALPPGSETDFRYKGGDHISDDAAMGFHLGHLGFKPEPWVGAEGWLEVELLTQYHPYLESNRWAITHPVILERN